MHWVGPTRQKKAHLDRSFPRTSTRGDSLIATTIRVSLIGRITFVMWICDQANSYAGAGERYEPIND
jgi:hypothetical protein